jgi:AcrR family transcriptional regulator
METAIKIGKAYQEYLLENGEKPNSVYAFAKKAKLKETEFYEEYNSFTAVEAAIWKRYFDETIEKLQQDTTYQNYGAREKLLAFYYTWVEVLKENRSYILVALPQNVKLISENLKQLQALRQSFSCYVKGLIYEGVEKQEVKQRPFFTEQYYRFFWLQLLFVLRFWLQDESKGFEKTDTAIEKAVNLSFEMIGNTTLDTAVDFIKFLIKK